MRLLFAILAMIAIHLAIIGAIKVSAESTTTNRLTYYTLRGTMYSGLQTHWGAAACSWGYPLGTQLQLSDGFIVTCLDRGHLGGGTDWVDVWCPDLETGRWLTQKYGDYAETTIIRWGF